MALHGYARVSTSDQGFALREQALRVVGCEVVRAEKVSGASREGRTELQILLDFLSPEDTLVVTQIDRLARSIKDHVHAEKARGHPQGDRVTYRYTQCGIMGFSGRQLKQTESRLK